MLDAIGGRKFIFAILVTVLAFVLVLLNKLTAQEFTTFAMTIGGIYVIGNVTSTLANNIKTGSQQNGN